MGELQPLADSDRKASCRALESQRNVLLLVLTKLEEGSWSTSPDNHYQSPKLRMKGPNRSPCNLQPV